MKLVSKILITITVLLSFTLCNAQIKNATTESVMVYGNCGMCKKTIEKAGNEKNISEVVWNKDTKIAMLTYDAKKTNQNEILKRIALSGYDSEQFLAPDDAYENLPGCCQYERVDKTPIKDMKTENKEDHSMHDHSANATAEIQKVNQLDAVYENYFAVKEALVKTDGKDASSKATSLLTSLNAVKMGELKMDVHMVWMKVMKDLKDDAIIISQTTDTKKQRASFDTLSENIYALIKVSKVETPVYYQHCPMANDGKGANWLSKEEKVKNPYYGSTMLSCGKTVETIK